MTSSAAARARARRQPSGANDSMIPQIARRANGAKTKTSRQETTESSSHLRVLPAVAPRRANMSRPALVVLMLALFTIGVIVFQATIAEQQLRLDALTNDLRLAELHYNDLRQERAELLSPSRLREEAVMMGMYQGLNTKFQEIPAGIVAEVMASTAKMNPIFRDASPSAASAGVLKQFQPIDVSAP